MNYFVQKKGETFSKGRDPFFETFQMRKPRFKFFKTMAAYRYRVLSWANLQSELNWENLKILARDWTAFWLAESDKLRAKLSGPVALDRSAAESADLSVFKFFVSWEQVGGLLSSAVHESSS